MNDFPVVWDVPEACPYLPGQTARMPLRAPPRRLTPEEVDEQLAAGDRRAGRLLYKPACPRCTACEPLRVPVAGFVPSKSQRRVWARNVDEITVSVVPPVIDDVRLGLFNRHNLERGLSRSGERMTATAYEQWFIDSICETVEVDYLDGPRLVAVSILDLGRTSASAVYHYFDPDASRRSLGVFSALSEMAWLRQQGKRWYYFGLYVPACPRLAYKAEYCPHERLVDGAWRAGTRRNPPRHP